MARSAITVVPPAVPVSVTIVAEDGAPATTFVSWKGSDEHASTVRITEPTTFWFDAPVFAPHLVTCVTSSGEQVFAKVVTTGPSFNPAVATCAAPVLPAPEPEPEAEAVADEPAPTRAPRKRKPKS